jgi:TPP-dependent pyruvate/acetoin dehydrogenase alpha subunit
MPGGGVAGNVLVAVHEAIGQVVERRRRGDGPTLIEAVTFGMGRHATSDDPTRYVPREVVEQWAKKDPVARLEAYLAGRKLLTKERAELVYAQALEQVNAAVKQAEATPPPRLESIFTDVYAEVPPHLRRQGQAAFELAARKGDASAGEGKFPL